MKIRNKQSNPDSYIKQDQVKIKRFKEPIGDLKRSLKSTRIEDLFEYAVKNIAKKSQTDISLLEPKSHKQWHQLCFDIPSMKPEQKQSFMSEIHNEYGIYFTSGFNKYTFDVDRIHSDYPQFFKGTKKPNNTLDQILLDIRCEINAMQNTNNIEKYRVQSIAKYSQTKTIYGITLELEDEEEPQFVEGLKVRLCYNSHRYECDCLDYDTSTTTFFVNCEQEIQIVDGNKGFVYLDTGFILEALYRQVANVKTVDLKSIPLGKIYEKKIVRCSKICQEIPKPAKSSKLDKSQKSAYNASIKNDITFVWGPPGTGKSHTLATLIHALFEKKENTLVCCISNVAVDQLINKFVALLKENKIVPSSGQIYRAGRSTDDNVLATDFLFPNDETSVILRERLREISQRIRELKSLNKVSDNKEEELEKKQQRVEISEKLKKHTEFLINSSHIVFSTIANALVSKSLCIRQFDNIIIDEASMMAMPYLIALTQRIAKRIIIVGDPKQLGPITLTQKEWLKKNPFDYCHVLNTESKALQSLLIQRRSHHKIVNLINKAFYEGRLESNNDRIPGWVKNEPCKGVVKVVNSGINSDKVSFRTGKSKSRYNPGTLNKVLSILSEYCNRKMRPSSIGIIAPYRSQVKLYIKELRDKMNGSNDPKFWESIKVGTIHTFQGSECDLIIFDIVEKSPTPVGKLFKGKVGEQLVNVVLSRAKYKIIIVGDNKRFGYDTGITSVSNKVCQVLSNLDKKVNN